MEIADAIRNVVDNHAFLSEPSIDQLIETDREVKRSMGMLVKP